MHTEGYIEYVERIEKERKRKKEEVGEVKSATNLELQFDLDEVNELLHFTEWTKMFSHSECVVCVHSFIG